MNWRTPLFIAILLLTALGVWWLLSGEQAGNRLDFALHAQQQRAAGGSDYYMEGVRSEQFSTAGQLAHVLQSPRIDHDPKLAQLRMQSPQVFLQRADGEPWQLNAATALANDDLQNIELNGDVRLSRGQGFKPNMIISTEHLQLDLQQERASTDNEVRFINAYGEITGIGLDADLKTEVLNLQHHVRGRYAQP